MPPKNAKKTTKTSEAEAPTASTSPELTSELPTAADKTSALDPSLRRVIEEVTGNITAVINQKLDPLSKMLQDHESKIEDLAKRTAEAEDRIASQEGASDQATARIETLEEQVQKMAQHIDDLENRGRRKNIRVVGLPEGAEGTQSVKFFEKWLPEFLQVDAKGGRIKLERAHRTLAPPPGPTQRPRPVLIRFHNYVDKQRVLEASRRISTDNQPHSQMYQGSKVMFFQDFSADVSRRRKGFDGAKKRLRDAGIQYSLLYPARLRITNNGSTKVFDSPRQVLAFVDNLE